MDANIVHTQMMVEDRYFYDPTYRACSMPTVNADDLSRSARHQRAHLYVYASVGWAVLSNLLATSARTEG